MTKQRIQVYADYEVKRRVELAAALYGVPVTEYCLSAIQRQLQEDDLLESSQIQISVKPGIQSDLVDNLRTFHDRILIRRNNALLDVDSALEQTREERDHELSSLR